MSDSCWICLEDWGDLKLIHRIKVCMTKACKARIHPACFNASEGKTLRCLCGRKQGEREPEPRTASLPRINPAVDITHLVIGNTREQLERSQDELRRESLREIQRFTDFTNYDRVWLPNEHGTLSLVELDRRTKGCRNFNWFLCELMKNFLLYTLFVSIVMFLIRF